VKHAVAYLSEIDRLIRGQDRLLVASDFDGTLCQIADSPSNVTVPTAIFETVRQLIGCERIILVIISGRAVKDLVTRLPRPVILGGNYGLDICGPNFRMEHAEAYELQAQLTKACRDLAQTVAMWKGAWVEDKTLTATVHYRNVNPDEHDSVVRAVRRSMAPYRTRLGMRAGQMAIEIHPRVAWNKGSCLTWIKQKLGLENHACVCFGDDSTDEAMFLANAGQINIRVGTSGRSAAEFYVSDVFEVGDVLAHITQVMRPSGAGAAR